MLRGLRSKKGQSTAEYAILIGLVVAVAIGIQTYVKRGLQGRFKDEVDEMAAGTSNLGTTEQYEPDYMDSKFVTDTVKDERIISGSAKNPTRKVDSEMSQTGWQKITKPE